MNRNIGYYNYCYCYLNLRVGLDRDGKKKLDFHQIIADDGCSKKKKII